MTMTVVNPATGETIKSYAELTAAEVAQAITETQQAFRRWRQTTFVERARLMTRAAATLRAHTHEYAVLMAQEMGKPVRDGRAEVEKCAWVCEYYAENAEAFLRPEVIPTDASKSFVTCRSEEHT